MSRLLAFPEWSMFIFDRTDDLTFGSFGQTISNVMLELPNRRR